MALKTFTTFLLIGICFAAPVDEPIRIDLPVYDHPEPAPDVLLAQPLTPENIPGGERAKQDQGIASNFATYKLQAVSNLVGGSVSAKANHAGGIFSAPVSTRETVLQETEGYGSQVLSLKENIHGIMAGILQPKPIVDTISEEEKYGNTGDKFYTAGKALVGGAEGFSNFINSVLEVPGTILKSITRAATEKLNNLGGRLIGL